MSNEMTSKKKKKKLPPPPKTQAEELKKLYCFKGKIVPVHQEQVAYLE